MASVILFTSVTAAVTLFNFTNINARLGEEKQDEQAAISDDLATIIQINDKFSCTDANNCSSGITYPNENEYIPGDPNGLSAICGPDGTGSGFGPKLVDAINNLALAPRLNELNITRSAKIPAAINTNNTPPHLYSIEWKKDSITLRQITLMPTVASWCP
ncbi:hypothetical protein KUL97_07290 [Synechococcus sp. HK05]|uniref:hypothetical protein n=1 Tax=Synechococcus sp. HK05 TaxID=2725975 RepID=UPI001C38B675|nr:hypothetical protein [Synechococcus sp. HK05]MBV2351510.1 hypothetical protein [Synechococcus sp. HK05]